MGGQLEFPCPDCAERSFATEAGLYMHRRKVCGLKGVKLTGLDFLCHGEGCGRAFSSPQGLSMHRRHCQKRLGRSQIVNYESEAATSSGRSLTAGANVSHSSNGTKVRRLATEVAGASSSAKGGVVVESTVEMDVRFELEQGKHAVVKYRVNSSARMQSVINKVAIKKMCEPKAVRLYKIAKPPGILRGSLPVLVSGTELASKYESSVLIATIS